MPAACPCPGPLHSVAHPAAQAQLQTGASPPHSVYLPSARGISQPGAGASWRRGRGGSTLAGEGGRAGRPEPRDGSRSVGAASQRAGNGSRRKLLTPAAGGGRRAARTGGGYLGSPARHALGRPPPVSVASSTDRSERAEQQRDPRYPGWDITAPARAARRRGGGLTCSLARAPHFRGTDLPVSPCLASRRGLA